MKNYRVSPLVLLALTVLFSLGCALTDVATSPETTPAPRRPTRHPPRRPRSRVRPTN